MNSVVSGLTLRQRRIDVVAVDVGDEMHAQARMRKTAQRAAHHLRAQVGAADADVDDVGDRLAGMAEPFAVAHGVGEGLDAGQHGMHVVTDILAIDVQCAAARRAQGGVQHGAVFGHIDFFAGEHGIALRFDAALARQMRTQQCKRASSRRFLE